MRIDITKIKSSFTEETEKLYEIDQEVEIYLKGSIVKHEVHSNQDGSANVVAVFKPEIIKVLDEKQSPSQSV